MCCLAGLENPGHFSLLGDANVRQALNQIVSAPSPLRWLGSDDAVLWEAAWTHTSSASKVGHHSPFLRLSSCAQANGAEPKRLWNTGADTYGIMQRLLTGVGDLEERFGSSIPFISCVVKITCTLRNPSGLHAARHSTRCRH